MNNFDKFDLDSRIIECLDSKKITEPTEIQNEVIPKILAGEDVIAQSRTGTGKTIAYIAPLLSKYKKNSKILVITPTKELARQVFDEFKFFASKMNLKCELLVSGDSVGKFAGKIQEDYDILVGVPGRILKLVDAGVLKLGLIKKVVIDEIDFLIDLGFKEDLFKIFDLTKNHDQVMIFSATLSAQTKKILNLAYNQKFATRVHAKNKLPDSITNYFVPLKNPNSDKDIYKRDEVLLSIMSNINPYLCIIFCRTKKESSWLYNLLKEREYEVAHLSGDLKSSQRKHQLDLFKKAKLQYLVSTDLASRGLDIDGINVIINYNLPVGEIDYLHRAGRTGRAGDSGMVYSIVNELDEGYLRKYAQNLEFDLTPLKIKKGKPEKDDNYQGVKARLSLGEIAKIEKIKHSAKKQQEKQQSHEQWKQNRRNRRPNRNRK